MPPNCTCVADDEEDEESEGDGGGEPRSEPTRQSVGGNSLGGETAMPQNCTRVEDDEGDGGGGGGGGLGGGD